VTGTGYRLAITRDRAPAQPPAAGQHQVGAAACRPGPRSCPEVPFAGGAPRYTALRY
jgi:hypothetical protein